jgi:hypothetical protein
MAASDAEPKQVIGCLSVLFQFLVCMPMWLALLGGILYHIDAPVWMWVLYCVYAPVALGGGFVLGFFKSVYED